MMCPICCSEKCKTIINLNCGNLDKSDLYNNAKVVYCTSCGHVYNYLNVFEKYDLMRYYDEEYAPFNLESLDKIGDRPGSNSPFTIKRYEELFNLIPRHIKEDSMILDVGCATGGFLNFLSKKGFKNLYGIDVIDKYINYANDNYDFNVKGGDVNSIPFKDNTFDLVILDQVLEHLFDLKNAIREIKRVLVNGGLLCIGVPDAENYDKNFFFDYYFFLMREHVQHFDLTHLKMLLEIEGFELMKFSRTKNPILNKDMILPNLNAIFYLNDGKKHFKLKNELEKYTWKQIKFTKKKEEVINKLVESQKPLYIWGIGREFHYLYENAGLKNCNIIGLIDDTPTKQKKFSVDGMKIISSSILKNASNSALIITAFAHIDKLKERALKIGYKGEIINV